MSLTLIHKNRPRRLSEPEIAALTAERVAAWKAAREADRAKREREINWQERLAFYGGKPSLRVRFWRSVVGVGAVLTAAGVTALLTTESQATLALILALGLGVTALALSLEEGK